MVDAADLKSATLTGVWVRVPPSAPDDQMNGNDALWDLRG